MSDPGTTPSSEAAWLPAPGDPTRLRWWDGIQWTDNYHVIASAAAGPAPSLPFRLLSDETVVGTFPIAQKRRAFGTLSSSLHVTTSRVVYSAQAKALSSSSSQTREYQLSTIRGIEVSRHTGLDALGVVVAIGAVLNVLLLVIFGIIVAVTASSISNSYGAYSPFLPSIPDVGPSIVFLVIASIIVGAVVVFIMARPRTALKVVGPLPAQSLGQATDFAKIFATLILFLVFGLFVGLVVIVWAIVRELGIFRAAEAQLYADPANVDRISHELGALILETQGSAA